MARSRNIKPGFFKNEELCNFPAMTRLLFAGLWTIADKSGRLEDRPRRIKAEVFPFDDVTADQIDGMLRELSSGKEPFIIRYSQDGCQLIQVVNWERHQSPYHREKESTLPPPNETNTVIAVNEPGQDRVDTRNRGNQESGIRNQESLEGGAGETERHFIAWWNVVPNKVGRAAAGRAYLKALKSIKGRMAEIGDGGDDPHGFLLARMLAFSKSPKAKGQYCPHPATWLNEGRYDDDPETWKSNGNEHGRRNDIGPGQRYDPSTAGSPTGF